MLLILSFATLASSRLLENEQTSSSSAKDALISLIQEIDDVQINWLYLDSKKSNMKLQDGAHTLQKGQKLILSYQAIEPFDRDDGEYIKLVND